jgi:hypothetical protein
LQARRRPISAALLAARITARSTRHAACSKTSVFVFPKSLRNERNRADYDVDRTSYQQRIAEAQVRKARQIAAALQQCRSGPNAEAIRAAVRAQAKLLGLSIVL